MNENEILAEMGKETIKQGYKDIGENMVAPTAKLLGTIPETINALLLPLNQWIAERQYKLEETKKLLAQKLEKVGTDNLVPPEAHIAVPALQYISYCMDNEELRDMYANLLASSMNKVVKNDVHPSYVEIIKQLCPDEAKILKIINQGDGFPLINVKYKMQNSKHYTYAFQHFSIVSELAGCERPLAIAAYLDNLQRLGLISIAHDKYLTELSLYIPLETHPFIKQLINPIKYKTENAEGYEFERSFFCLSNFGRSFTRICISNKQTQSTTSKNA